MARSTISDVLRGWRLPSGEALAAFVRSCGKEERDVLAWLEARQRILDGTARTGPRPDGPDEPVEEAAEAAGSTEVLAHTAGTRWFRGGRFMALAGVMAAVTGGLWMALYGSAGDPSVPSQGAASASRAGIPVGTAAQAGAMAGWVEIRPARTPQLCLTEGRDRTGQYVHAVAAQRPCGEARPPHTYLKAAPGTGSRAYLIEWHHPRHGRGCLSVRGEDVGKGLLEPWQDCAASPDLQQFRIERAGRGKDGPYRLRLEGTARCVGIRAADTSAGAEAVVQSCGTGEEDQKFLIIPAA
ncbi:RICIN domain-containing protein [Streptomyces sp. NPDC048441]|uniref:RICIN domain-containing protein n=1 Tax=Streptomyces sp. NPDC048441 TaxID=3365552 RepID=UPI00371A38F2